MPRTSDRPRAPRRPPESNGASSLLVWLRLAATPLFAVVVLAMGSPLVGLVVVVLIGVAGWRTPAALTESDSRSRLSAVLPPLVDRVIVLTVMVVLAVGGHAPWWLTALVLLRDLVLAALVPLLRTRGRDFLPPHFVGQAATRIFMYASPLLLLSGVSGSIGTVSAVLGWAATLWGVGLYWWSGAIYVWQLQALVQQVPPQRSGQRSRPASRRDSGRIRV